ncbi:uncharacterized protein [Battus philenor]|uniref:uncharacterized protein n=1 Tax=Battus philenor TaxID=42288 RepID=UPI0035D113E5
MKNRRNAVAHISDRIVDDIKGVIFLVAYLERKIEIIVFAEIMYFLRQRLLLIKEYFITFLSYRNKEMSYTSRKLINNAKRDKCINFIGRVSDRNKKILDLATAYDNAGQAFKLINDIYNFIILLMIISAFLVILSIFYTSLSFLKVISSDKIAINLITTFFWIAVELGSIIFVSYYCEKVLKAREEIKVILNNIIIYDDLPKHMRRQTKVFIELIETWPMEFHVSNMFQIDKKIVLKFISICTSYLIIFIQISGVI